MQTLNFFEILFLHWFWSKWAHKWWWEYVTRIRI